MAKKMIEMIDENQNEDINESKMDKEPKVRKVSKTKKESKDNEETKVKEVTKAMDEPKTKKESKSKKEVKAKRESKVKKSEENEVTSPPKKLKRNKSKSSVKLDQLWFEPDCILGATDCWHGQMAFRFKVKDSDDIEILPAKIAKVLCPQLVINFYQDHLVFIES